jgi:hypothetical protein
MPDTTTLDPRACEGGADRTGDGAEKHAKGRCISRKHAHAMIAAFEKGEADTSECAEDDNVPTEPPEHAREHGIAVASSSPQLKHTGYSAHCRPPPRLTQARDYFPREVFFFGLGLSPPLPDSAACCLCFLATILQPPGRSLGMWTKSRDTLGPSLTSSHVSYACRGSRPPRRPDLKAKPR